MRLAAYLIMMLLFSTATAQNPTILQGNYISNVFGQSNFVKNPNAQTGLGNISNSNATITRSTTTPLVATTEFNWNASVGGFSTWSLRPLDEGMKNQNCEARFTYRGFTAGTTTAQIRNSGIVIAELVLTPSATDPRIASINFPCGDLSLSTNFRLLQSGATLGGINEIGGIYVGLATNQANIAQAEFYGSIQIYGCSSVYQTSGTAGVNWESFSAVTGCSYVLKGKATAPSTMIPALKFDNLPIGNYKINFTGTLGRVGAAGLTYFRTRTTDGTFVSEAGSVGTGTNEAFYTPSISTNLQITNTGAKTIEIQALNNSSAKGIISVTGPLNSYDNITISVYRFPSSSELVVTPETQNVFGGVKLQGSGYSNFVTSNAWAKFTSASTLTRTVFGKAKVETNNDHSITIENMPVGNYYISYTGLLGVDQPGSGSTTYCRFALADSPTGGWGIAGAQVVSTGDASVSFQENDGQTLTGIYNNTSVGTRTFYLQAKRVAGVGRCYVYSDANTGSTFSVIPIDNNANSALYVQGPVKAAGTGTAIPAGYVGEIKEISTTTSVFGVPSAAYNINYAPWSSTLELNAGVWSICYQGQVEVSQTASTSYSTATSFVENITDATVLMDQLTTMQSNSTARDFLIPHAACRTVNITSTKQFQLKIRAGVYQGSPTLVAFNLRCFNTCYLQATRIN